MNRSHLKSSIGEKENHHVQMVIFVCLGFLLYVKTFGHTWTFDDYFVILNNLDVRSFKDFINNEYPESLTGISIICPSSKLFGFEPKYWHIQNCLIHSINAWMIYLLLMNLSSSKSLSWLSSLLFLVHPIQVEVVAQVSHRKDSLCLLFILIAFYFYVLARSRKSLKFLFMSSCAFMLSLLSKESAYAFPLIIVAYEMLLCDKNLFASLKYKNLLCLVSLFSSSLLFYLLYIQYFFHGSKYLLFTSNVISDYSTLQYYLTVFSAWGFIIEKLFWPFGLSVNYLIMPPEGLLDYRFLFLMVFISLSSITAYYAYHKSKLLLFFILWFIVFFLPTSSILPFTKHFVADRYLYIPSVGLCVAVVILVKGFFSKNYMIISLSIVFAFSLITFNQVSVWENNLLLWENSLKYNPYSSRTIMNVAIYKYADNDDLFLENINKAIGLNPDDPFPYNSLASFYYEKNMRREAIENYEKFIELINMHSAGVYKQFSATARERLDELRGVSDK